MRVSMHRRLLPMIVVLALIASFVPVFPAIAIPAEPKTIYVDAVNGDDVGGDGTADNPYMSITVGLGDANYGDTIDIAPGTYSVSETGETFPLPISPSKITLQGSDPYECIIDAEWSGAIAWLAIGSEFTVSGLTLTHGVAVNGGAVMVGLGTLTMSDCVLTQNTAQNGGAIYAADSFVTLTDCEFIDNGESAFDMLPAGMAPQDVTECFACGAVMSLGGTLDVDGCTFGGNSATEVAGAIGAESSDVEIADSTFYENEILVGLVPNAVLDFTGSGLVPAQALPFGGAVLVGSGELAVTGSAFWSNSAVIGSSLIGIDASMTVEGCWFEGDTTMAGVVANIGDMFLNASTDALGELAPTVEMPATSLTVEGSTFDGNEGAPIAAQSVPARISNCLITNNQASGGEGPDQGVLLFFDSDADIVNTTIADNSSSGFSIYSTLMSGTSILPEGGVRVTNSIVWDEFAEMGPVYGADVAFSDLYPADPIVPELADPSVISEDPMFADSESGDYSLAAGSPCIDTGVDFELAPDADIDGTPRPLDGDASGIADWDMGAYEFGGITDGRIEGLDRYETGVAISEDHFAAADTAVLATGRVFADGLAAAGLAGAYNAPVLLTQPRALPASVAAELLRLGVSRVVVCGDQRAISDAVVAQVEALGEIEVQRIGGVDRYETAAMIADEIVSVTGEDPALVFVARGDTYPDALAVSPIAWAHSAPILLVRPEELPRYTVDYLLGLTGATRGVIVGGSAAVSTDVQGDIAAQAAPTFERISGVDRYDTAAEVAYWADDEGLAGFGVTGVATGEDFADALCAGPGLGSSGGVLLLTPRHTAAQAALDAISAYAPSISALQIFGSGAAIDEDVAIELDAARRG